MALDLVLLVLVGVFALRGFLRGSARSALDLLGWLGAYAAAILLGPGLGPAVASATGAPELVGRAIACLGVAFAVWLAFSIASGVVGRRRRRGPAPGLADRLGGALLGSIPALLLATLIGWGAGFVSDVSQEADLDVPSTESSRLAGLARRAVAGGARLALSDAGPAGIAAAEALADPAAALRRVRTLVDEPRVRALGSDSEFWREVEAGRLDAALARPSFLEVAHSAEVRAQFAALGFVPEAAMRDSLAFRAETRAALEEIGPRMRAIRNDPALARLMEDPEVQAKIQSGDTLGVMLHPDFRALVGRALETPPPASDELAHRAP